jgi:hypothetical protein
MPASASRRDDRALRAARRELRKPSNLVRYLRKSGGLTTPLLFAGPTLVLVAYVVAFLATPGGDVSREFYASASQIIPVLLLVLAVEGQAFRWQLTASSIAVSSRDELVADGRFRRYADGEGPIADAVEALLDAAVESARSVADTLLRQATALLLLASMVLGEIVSLVPLLSSDDSGAGPKPVMAAIVAGFAGVAYVAITGSRFIGQDD